MPAKQAGEGDSASSPSPSLLNSLFTALQNPINTIPDIAAELGLSIPGVAALLATPEAKAHFAAIEHISAARCRLELTEARPAAIAALRDLTYDNRTPETTRKAATRLLSSLSPPGRDARAADREGSSSSHSSSRGGGILPPSPHLDEPEAQARVFPPSPHRGEGRGEGPSSPSPAADGGGVCKAAGGGQLFLPLPRPAGRGPG